MPEPVPGPLPPFSSAFAGTAADLALQVRAMEVDHAALRRPLNRCDLAVCGGTCCHDGVYLNPDEAAVIREVTESHRKFFTARCEAFPADPIVAGSWRDGEISGPKTATRPAPMRRIVRDYPEHFAETRCVFLTADHHCALQLFGVASGVHPWHFKPFTCWIHPLSIAVSPGGGRTLTLPTPETDPQRYPDYDGFASRTPCGRSTGCGLPAHEVLQPEIAALGRIGGRNLAAELKAGAG